MSRGATTRDRVLEAASRCFADDGFKATTTARVAREAGVAEGTVFVHFKTKQDLLSAVISDFYARVQAEAEEIVLAGDPPAARLRRLVGAWAQALGREWTLMEACMAEATPAKGSPLADVMAEGNRRYTRLFVGVVRELQATGQLPADAPASLLRDVIFGTLEHAARGASVRGEPLHLADEAGRLLDLLVGTPPALPGADRIAALERKVDRVLDHLESQDAHGG